MSHLELWENWNRNFAPRYPHNKLIQFILRRYKNNKGNIKILDLGCGSGNNTKFLCEAGFEVYATDFSEEAITNTKNLLNLNNLVLKEIRKERISELSFEKNFFDCIVSVGVFESAGKDETEKCIGKVYNCLKEGGVGFFLFAAKDDFRMQNNFMNLYGYEEHEVREIFGSVFKNFYLDHYITTFNNQKENEHDFIVTAFK